jgi:hypothetical protein
MHRVESIRHSREGIEFFLDPHLLNVGSMSHNAKIPQNTFSVEWATLVLPIPYRQKFLQYTGEAYRRRISQEIVFIDKVKKTIPPGTLPHTLLTVKNPAIAPATPHSKKCPAGGVLNVEICRT